MEKLIELLNRYGKDDDWCLVREEGIVRKINELLIISKQYGFVKWLVYNDKIDFSKIFFIYYGTKDTTADRLIMKLSISSDPLKFLCSILK